MSLSGAMNSAVSALKAQSQALSMISDNLANSSTTGYKGTTASFSTIVTQMYSGTAYPSGGVRANGVQNVSEQGLISSTSTATNLALDGNGMFVVRYGTGDQSMYFTRDGEFYPDHSGNLVTDQGYYLLGWPTDANGNTSSSSELDLEVINISDNASSVAASTKATIYAKLPATATSGTTYNTTSLTVYNSLGVEATVPVNWTKTSTSNQWTVTYGTYNSVSNQYEILDTSGNVLGTVNSPASTSTLNFDTSGNLVTSTSTINTLGITWASGATTAANSSITMDFSGINQTSSGSRVSVTSQSTDGHSYGSLLGVTTAKDGTITANYSNGQAIPIYKVAVATFPNYNGLDQLSNNVYAQTSESGDYTLHTATDGGAGAISGSALENSTVDTADEFSKMIVAQQAYSAASQVITSAKDMFDTLLSAVR